MLPTETFKQILKSIPRTDERGREIHEFRRQDMAIEEAKRRGYDARSATDACTEVLLDKLMSM